MVKGPVFFQGLHKPPVAHENITGSGLVGDKDVPNEFKLSNLMRLGLAVRVQGPPLVCGCSPV